MALEARIRSKAAVIGVIGLGYVGLPLALEFSLAGYRVIGLDIQPDRVLALREGRSYVLDVTGTQVKEAVASGRLEPTGDVARLSETDAIIICVPTPLRKTKDPDLSYIVAAVNSLRPYLHRSMLVVLESTSYPGTTEDLVRSAVEAAGYEVGSDVFVCFSPERVDPGNRVYMTKNTPKVVGGITPACTEMGALLYSQIVDAVVPVSSARNAEMVKLLENTFRAVNIALINELAMMCERIGVDIWEVIDAASTKPFGFMPFYPGPGIGGHCIPLDPAYLSWKARTHNFHDRFIDLASDINANMPAHVVRRIGEILNLEGKPLSGSRVLALGVAYKRNVNDIRESPGLDVIRLLRQSGTLVGYSDPHVPELHVEAPVMKSIDLTPDTLNEYDCAVLLTDHSAFDLDLIARYARVVLDTRNAFKRFSQSNILRIGAALPSH